MHQHDRRSEPKGRTFEEILLWVGISSVIALVGMSYLALHVGHRFANTGEKVPANPFDAFFGTLRGEPSWPQEATWVLVGLGLLVVLVTLIVVAARGRRKSRVDSASKFLGRGRDLDALSRKGVSATAQRLGVGGSSGGVLIGLTVPGARPLYGSWEDMHVDIWGPRTGKTTSRVVPAILDAPGGVLVTSNKRDVVDATRDVRAAAGGAPIWVFDPQAIAHEPPTWWWDPLSYVTDEVKAAKMAEHFATGSRDPGARTDAYFDPAGQDLLAGLILAAALDRRSITQVYTWLTRPMDDLPVEILEEHGYSLTAEQVSGAIAAPEKQRGGIYGTAQQMASCLTSRSIARWITPQGDLDRRPHFDTAEFVAQGGTLYSLSKEGQGTAGPLVTALTAAVVESAEELASHSPGGRLTTPLLGVLDETANVCRWKELPNLYSHYGSRGIVLMTVLQSWSQGVEVWGREGMRKLWSASNVKVYGGGVSEVEFLNELSQLIGDFDLETSSVSHGKKERTVSKQTRRERILDVADLGAMPRGRAVVFASGTPPALVRTVPWMEGPYAAQVNASLAAHDPQVVGPLEVAQPDDTAELAVIPDPEKRELSDSAFSESLLMRRRNVG